MKRIFLFLTLISLVFYPFLNCIASSSESWVIAIYFCGSDLESEEGLASFNINQMLEAKLPQNVKIVFETGGASKWDLEIDPKKNQRYEITSKGSELIEEKAKRNMGASETLSDFIKFVKTKYKNADHVMFIMWDHGGGSAGGFAIDENTEDYLSLDEIDDAFSNAFEATNNKKFDIIGFDACLMSALDVAIYLSQYGDYMIASQETEPGTGWNYEAILKELYNNSGIQSVPLGKTVINSYKNQCDSIDQGASATLTMLDLSKIPELFYDYMMLGFDVANKAAGNKEIIRNYGRSAKSSESFGEGKFGMIDLNDFIKKFGAMVPESAKKIQKSLSDAVIYNVTGKYHKSAGVSIFYPIKKDDLFEQYDELTVSSISPHAVLSSARLGVLSEKEAKKILPEIYSFYQENVDDFVTTESKETSRSTPTTSDDQTSSDTFSNNSHMRGWYESFSNLDSQTSISLQNSGGFWGTLQNMNIASAVLSEQTDINLLEDHDVYFNKKNYLTVKLTEKELDQVEDVHFVLFYYDEDDDKIMIDLGSDSDIDIDWDKGIITDAFDGEWPAIDGHLLHSEIEYMDDDFDRYVAPIKLNGKRVDLIYVYDYRDGKFHILGCREPSETTVSRRNTIKLKPGDRITTLMPAQSLENAKDDDDFEEVEIDTFKYKKKTKIEYEELGDCTLLYMFKFIGANNDYSTSKVVKITIEGDKHIQEILD